MSDTKTIIPLDADTLGGKTKEEFEQEIELLTELNQLLQEQNNALKTLLGNTDISAIDKTVTGGLSKLNNNLTSLGGFKPVIDESTGKITGYTTSIGGADTVFPFSSFDNIKCSASTIYLSLSNPKTYTVTGKIIALIMFEIGTGNNIAIFNNETISLQSTYNYMIVSKSEKSITVQGTENKGHNYNCYMFYTE